MTQSAFQCGAVRRSAALKPSHTLPANIWVNFCCADTREWDFWISWTTHMFSFSRHSHTAFQLTPPPAVCGACPFATDLPPNHSPSPRPQLTLGLPQVALALLLSAPSRSLLLPGASEQDFPLLVLLLALSSPG